MSDHAQGPVGLGVPAFGFSRLLWVVTGALTAQTTTGWLTLLRTARPELDVQVVTTTSAERFVTREVLTLHAGREALRDEWPQGEGRARHVEWWDWADGILIAPATLHFMGRLALGLGDSPALLAAQCARVPIGVAPAVPPGGVGSPAYQAHWAALRARPNVVLAAPRPGGTSITTGRDTESAAPLPEVLALMEQLRVQLAEGDSDNADADAFDAERGSR